ncbi:methyl-accepting chemotaxis protein [Thalassotalea sp. ND16A]|uniref:methyl-accepting chemotaxis protein n=1 Tax=Thalassotalea sp. ND16A TaxID=1535422 RepID=UPI00051A2E15|nr:methyl-accepting chemotaxis protein [Thalassotalea sp. ND16A]KGJ92101.1 putative methyl-accepting chemotaxis sensory transducer [Thalassotalea sp. ND16A]
MKIKYTLIIALSIVLIATVTSIVAGVVTTNKNESQLKYNTTKYLSFVLADEFRHTSINLTRLARTYVATGEQKYLDQYMDIVNWRAGKIPRPTNVNKSLYPSVKKSQSDIMKELNFSVEELNLLKQASEASNDLISTETQAIESVKAGMIVNGPFQANTGESAQSFALRILFDELYHQEVTKIMMPVTLFFSALEQRTEAKVDQGNEELSFWLSVSTMMQIVSALTLFGGAFYIGKKVFFRLNQNVEHLKSMLLSDGRIDLTATIEEAGNDEISILVNSMDFIHSQIKDLVLKLNTTMVDLLKTSDNLSGIVTTSEASLLDQENKLTQIATATNQMVATVQEVASHSSDASVAASASRDKTEFGLNIIKDAVLNMDKLSEEINTASTAVDNLDSDSTAITSVLDVIRGIADQTNLLALNAAIEAARAGEQGRGFAVVADEVRQLAKRTQDSTMEIQAMIEKLQINSKTAVSSMMSSKEQSVTCVDITNQAGQILEEISNLTTGISDMSTSVATACEEQSVVIEDINQNIHGIIDSSEITRSAVESTADNSVSLQQLSDGINAQLSQFKV